MAAAPAATSADVAAIIPERVSTGAADFDADTIPTVTQVTAIITGIVGEVQAVVGATIDDSLAALGTLTVATGAAAAVELAFTNQVARDTDTKYEWLQERYRGAVDGDEIGGLLGILDKAQRAIDAGGEEGDTATGQPWATMPDPATTPVTTWTGGW